MITATVAEKSDFLAGFERLEKELAKVGSPALHRLRKSASARFDELGLPTTDEEEWRFTNLAPLARRGFRAAAPGALQGERFDELFGRLGVDPTQDGLVFVNGECSEPLLAGKLPPGVVVQRLSLALAEHPELVEPHLARHARFEQHAFTALNTAFLREGAFVYVSADVTVERPIHLVFVSTVRGEPTVTHPRNLIVAGPRSRLTVVESYVGRDGDVYFTNAVSEIVVGAHARIDHYKVQEESVDAFHLATTQVVQEEASRFSSHAISLGGALARNEVNADLNAVGCECTLNGLYMADGEQLVDNHTRIEHAKPHCTSHELYKGILSGKARGVFSGRIHVHQDAQKTDAKQTNQTLLLSEDATIDTKPQLEIFADDVKCTHGATVGQLDEDSIFYLRTRGIGAAEARSLLTFAFANDIVRRVQVEPIRAKLEELLLVRQHLPSLGREES